MNNKYEAVIGLEIHAELKTKSKMFCPCANDPFNSEPNAHVCPICMGFPGTLPVPNKKAVELTLALGQALQCKAAAESKFDRKNYFYPDLPKGYQISQYDLPLMGGGQMTVEGKRVGIRRVHLEEDTGKLVHKEGTDHSLVDYNRAGVPLLELVTEPHLTSAIEAAGFAKELQHILRSQDASLADMEKGQMRVEANVSIRPTGTNQMGTKVEVKNLNSFRSVEKAIQYEVKRMIGLLEEGKKIVQETRGWDEDKGQTFSQRTKEEAEDYRYFPEPDIPPLSVANWDIQTAELPSAKRQRYVKLGLTEKEAQILVTGRRAQLFESVMAKGVKAKTAARWIINEGIDPSWGVNLVVDLLTKIESGTVTAPAAKEAIKKAKETGKLELPENGQVISDQQRLAVIINDVLTNNSSAVADFKAGKGQAFGFLVGQVMAKTKGQASPQMVNDLLKKKLEA